MSSARRSILLPAALACAAALSACATGPAGPAAERAAARSAPPVLRPGTSPYGLFLAGQAALDAGRAREAAALFARARAGAPDNGVLRARAFTAALSAGELDRAATLAAELDGAADPTAGLGRLVRAVDALAEGRGRDAYALLNVGVLQPPHGLAVEILKPWAAASAGDLQAALAAGPAPAAPLKAGEIDPALLARNLNPAGRLDLLERAGRFAEADAILPALTGAEAPVRHVLKAGAYLERRRRAGEAAALYARALEARSGTASLAAALARAEKRRPAPAPDGVREGAAEALIIPAVAFAGGRQYESAQAYLRMALHLDPEFDEARLLLGDVLSAAGDAEGARRAYLAVDRRSDGFAQSRARLALALQEAGRREEAVATVRAAVEAAPADASVLAAYAALLSEQGRHAEAADIFDARLATQAGRADWRLWYLRGSARERAGRWAEAERDLLEARRLAPEEPEVLNALGYGWIDRGLRLEEALGMVEQAARLRPRSGAIIDSLGWARYRLGRYEEAVRDLERAVELEPGDPTINDHLGDAYWRAGRRIEAQFQWTRALSLEPDAKLRAEVAAKLASPMGPDVVQPAARAAQSEP